MTIREKIEQLSSRKTIFLNQDRIGEGKTYIPEFLLGEVDIDELLAVLYGLKPVMQHHCHERDVEDIKKSLEELSNLYGLNYRISSYKYLINSPEDFVKVVDAEDDREGIFSYSVSFDDVLNKMSEEYFLKKSRRTERAGEFSKKFGKIMGYPECCIKFGDSLSGNKGDENAIRENRVWSKAHIRSFMNSSDVSRLLNVFTIDSLIPHVPCSLDCEKSKRYASKMLGILEKEDERLAELRRYFLNLNSLFWYYSEFYLFDGEKSGKELVYHDFHKRSYSEDRFYGGLKDGFREKFERTGTLLERGNRLVMGRDCFRVFDGRERLGTVEKEYPFENILF